MAGTTADIRLPRCLAKTDGPTLVECVVDPDEANLPPKIPTGQAINFMKAMARGQPSPVRIGLRMFCNEMDELLVQGFGSIPEPEGAQEDEDPDVR